jgi:hypothetical protein
MNSRAKKFLLLALAAALLTANGFLLPVLNRERGALGITRIEPLENAPPMLALTTQVLGGFRGLIANALWIRSTQLQEDGKYFEMVQLADWITKLEPHITTVWTVQAWNMAFNISVKFPNHADRWRWVQRGIELLRDDAIRYNPDQPGLYGDLAWMFQFKMGQNMDDAHWYYKDAWANEMTQVLQGVGGRFDGLINPQTPLQQEQARLLRSKYKMDPVKMREVNERYGPLDWRLPEAHSIYWASVGLDKSRKDEDVRRLRTAIYQSMNLSFQRGRLVLSSNMPPRLLPNLEIVSKVDAAYQEQLTNSPAHLTNGISKAYRNFLRDVPYQYFIINRTREAEEWLRYLRQKFPDAAPSDETLAEYAVGRAAIQTLDQRQAYITGLMQAFIVNSFRAAIDGQSEDAQEYLRRAQELYAAYNKRTAGNQRIAIPTVGEVYNFVAEQMLAPDSGLGPEEMARLRTLLGRPAPAPVPLKPQ